MENTDKPTTQEIELKEVTLHREMHNRPFSLVDAIKSLFMWQTSAEDTYKKKD